MDPLPPANGHTALLRLREVTLLLPGSGSIGPITWALERRRRIGVRCASEAQWEVFCSLLSGQAAPRGGIVDEWDGVTVQTDVHLRAGLSGNATLDEFLDAPEAPEFVWLDGRRRSMMVLVDLLGITPSMRRRPLKLAPPGTADKVWALRFTLSQASVLIGRELFRCPDPLVQDVLRRRWADWPGTVLVGLDGSVVPGPLDGWVRIDAEGHFTAGEGPPESGDAAEGGGAPPI